MRTENSKTWQDLGILLYLIKSKYAVTFALNDKHMCSIIQHLKRGIAKSSFVCEGAPKIPPSGRN